jgi:triosephosphate isomerase
MHHGPRAARAFFDVFLAAYRNHPDRQVWFFPPAVSLLPVIEAVRSRSDLAAGVQNIHWEPQGAFTGELSAEMAKEAGAAAALVGHSERRHLFGETDQQAGLKVRAALRSGMTAVFCVGEQLAERDRGETWAVIERQLAALDGLTPTELASVVVAYEPVWAIGTGRNASPADAASVHASIRTWFEHRGVSRQALRVLYGGSVNRGNIAALIAEAEINGVLVGGASLDPDGWAQLVSTPAN